VKPKPTPTGSGKVLVLAVRCCGGTLGDKRKLGEPKAEVEWLSWREWGRREAREAREAREEPELLMMSCWELSYGLFFRLLVAKACVGTPRSPKFAVGRGRDAAAEVLGAGSRRGPLSPQSSLGTGTGQRREC
jgi:hypothetical protein